MKTEKAIKAILAVPVLLVGIVAGFIWEALASGFHAGRSEIQSLGKKTE